MSSFRATLEFAGKEYNVLLSEYEFSRNTDSKGKPSSNIQDGQVSVVIEYTDDTATVKAMLNSQFRQIEGKIIYKKIEEDANIKEIEFKNAYIMYYKEIFDGNNKVPVAIFLTFSAEQINVSNIALDNGCPQN